MPSKSERADYVEAPGCRDNGESDVCGVYERDDELPRPDEGLSVVASAKTRRRQGACLREGGLGGHPELAIDGHLKLAISRSRGDVDAADGTMVLRGDGQRLAGRQAAATHRAGAVTLHFALSRRLVEPTTSLVSFRAPNGAENSRVL